MRSLGIFLLMMWIALSNVGVGFALAVCFGHGPQRWPRWRMPKLPKFAIRLPRPRWPKWRVGAAEPEAAQDDFVSMDVALAELQAETERMK